MKRLLSLILVAVMLISLLPTVAFATDGVTVEYSFKQIGSNTKPETALTFANTQGRFAFEKMNSGKTTGVTQGLYRFDIRNGNYVAFRLRVPKTGNYTVTFNPSTVSKAPNTIIADMYVIPGDTTDIAAALTEQTRLIKGITEVQLTESYSAEKALTAGEWLFVFKRTGWHSSGNTHDFRPKSLTLTLGTGTGKALIWAEMSPEDETVFVGESTTLNTTAYMSDGLPATADEKKLIEYVSLNTNVAKTDGNKVIAVGEGTATIQAKSGDLLLAETKITAEIRIPEAIAEASLAFRADSIPVGYSDVAKLSLVSEKGGEYIDPYTVTYESSAPTVASVDEETGKLTALKSGEVTVTAHITDAKQNDLTAEKTLQITEPSEPTGQPVSINFNAVTRDEAYKEVVSGKNVYPVWAFSGAKIKVVEEKTTTYKTHLNVKNEGVSAADGVTKTKSLLLLSTEAQKWPEGDGRQGRITFKINMNTTEPGWYNVSLTGGKWASASVWYVFFGDEYAGLFSNRDIDYPGNSPWAGFAAEQLNTVYIEPDADGWAEMSFMLADFAYGSIAGSPDKSLRASTARILLESLTLTPAVWWSSADEITVNAPEKIIVGEKSTLTAYVGDSDSYPAFYGEYDIGRTEEKDNFFTAEVISGDSIEMREENTYADGELIGNAYSATVVAKKPGETVLRFYAEKDGIEFTRDVTVTVEEYPMLETVKLSLEKNSIPATRTTSASVSLIRAGDGKEYTEDYTLRYESTVTEVAEIDENTGEITAKNKGTTVIRAIVTDYKGNEVTDEVTLRVTDKPVLDALTVSGRQTLLPGDSAQLSVQGVMTDGAIVDAGNYEIKYESTDESILTVSDTGEISAHKLGSAAVTVIAVNEKGVICPQVIAIDVVEALSDIVVDFSDTVEAAGRGVPTVTPGYTILTNVGNADYFRKFKTEEPTSSARIDVFQIRTSSKDNIPWPECGDTQGTFAISVNADAAGYYSMSVTGGVWYAAGDYSVYVNDTFAGDTSFYQTDAENRKLFSGEEKKLNTVYLQKGQNEIVFRLKKNYEGASPSLLLNNITFRAVKGDVFLEELVMSEIPSQLAVGEVFENTMSVKLADESVYAFGPSVDRGEYNQKNAASFSVIGDCVSCDGFDYEICNSHERTYKLTALKPGEAKLVFNLVVNGETKTFEYPIRVIEDELVGADARVETEELYAGDTSKLIPKAIFKNKGVSEGSQSVTASYESLTPEIATVEDGMLVTHAEGTAKIKVNLSFYNAVTGETDYADGTAKIEVQAQGMAGIKATAGGSETIRLTDKGREDTVPLYAQAISNLGEEMDMTGAVVSAKALTPEYAEIDGTTIIPVSEGEARFAVTVTTSDKRTRTEEVTLRVVYGKSKSTYYTAEKAEAARENYKLYKWAKQTADSYIKRADKHITNLDTVYSLIPSEGLPRTIAVGEPGDPLAYNCRYCNTDLMVEYSSIPWLHDPINRPWKTQCPDCKRLFPSNDFEGFYKLGLNEYGEFDRLRALNAHRELFGDKSVTEPGTENSAQWKAYYGYGVEGGYLYNELYTDLADAETLNCGEGLREGETEATWGVDDGMGYVPSKSDGTPYTFDDGKTVGIERHSYIAEYVHFGLWRRETSGYAGAILRDVIMDSAYAYYYTGDVKYGRVAALLLDRMADFYPDYEVKPWIGKFRLNDGGTGCGGIMGNIVEAQELVRYMTAYDMVYDVYDDPFVVDFLAEKGKTLKFRHAKETPSQIRTNIEDGILRTVLQGLRDHSINGNFGLAQQANAVAAVVLDSMPETEQWLDYLMAPGWHRNQKKEVPGGGIDEVLVNTIDADGQGDEASQYNLGWMTNLLPVQEVLDSYDRYTKANLYNHPKFVQMLYSNIPLIATYYTPAIGDSGTTQGKGMWLNKDVMLEGWKNIGDPVFAQLLYKLNGNSAEGLRYGINEKDPERLSDEVRSVIEEYGEFEPKSEMMTNFGFGIIRDGHDFTASAGNTAKDTRRDVWMYFGNNTGHGHLDTLNLGMSAYGLELLPDLGYPVMADQSPNRLQWVTGTTSHNTVLVNNREQYHGIEPRGDIKHFDSDTMVSLMDVSTPYLYPAATDEYRRSVVMIKVNDEISYTVDFFRVLGGYEHVYSFHAASNNIVETAGLGEIVPQMKDGEYAGTLAGIDVPYGADPGTASGTLQYPKGYTWIDTIDFAENPEDKFEIDFEIKDFNKNVKDSDGIRLRMMMHNEGNVNDGADVDVKIGNGYPPNKAGNKNIDKLKYVIVKNSGSNLDTVFTTVLEPYRNTRYLASSEELEMQVSDGAESSGDTHRVLKITHESGRVDYVFYATNSSVTYKLTDEIAGENRDVYFRGFVGVYTVNDAGANIYSYVHDGDIIGESTNSLSAVTGVLKSFTQELSGSNELVIIPRQTMSEGLIAELPGRYVFVDNGVDVRSGTWRIEAAYMRGNDLVLDVGRVTAIRRYVDVNEPEKGFEYTVAPGQSVSIPLSYSAKTTPIIETVPDGLTVSAGSSITVDINANSPIEDNPPTIKYQAETLPRGASVNADTGVVTWKPDSSQVGDNHFAVTAVDSDGRESTVHFIVTVYGSTTSKPSTESDTSTDNSGTSGGGGGGGGGGGDAAPDNGDSSDQTDVPQDTDSTQTDESGEKAPDASGETEPLRFTDLGNHSWAEDAINTLAADGIIKGTSASTYSPSNNITRADFALLLVRAFNLASDNTENFADVAASDYFAPELAIARNTGIVGGIGDNKYAPRNTITRQDMMVIVYRALQNLGNVPSQSLTATALPEGEPSEVENYPDFAITAPYAQDAVSALIGEGLVNGKNGLIAPADYTTRAEVAVLLKRILDYIK